MRFFIKHCPLNSHPKLLSQLPHPATCNSQSPMPHTCTSSSHISLQLACKTRESKFVINHERLGSDFVHRPSSPRTCIVVYRSLDVLQSQKTWHAPRNHFGDLPRVINASEVILHTMLPPCGLDRQKKTWPAHAARKASCYVVTT